LFHVLPLIDAWATLPQRITDLQTAVELLPDRVIPLVTKPVLVEVDKQVGGIRKDLFHQVDAIRLGVLGPDGQLSAITGQLNQRVDTALATVQGIRRYRR
jgi:hypothetical protein